MPNSPESVGPAPNDPFGVLPLQRAFSHFFKTLSSSALQDSSGDYVVDGIAAGVALSQATQSLFNELHAVQSTIRNAFATPAQMPKAISVEESDGDGVWTPVPESEIVVSTVLIGGLGADAVLMAGVDAAARVVSFPPEKWNAMNAANPGDDHQRWHHGDRIDSRALSTLRVAERFLNEAVARLVSPQWGESDPPSGRMHQADQLIAAMSRAISLASELYKAQQRLENLHKDGTLPREICTLNYSAHAESPGPEGNIEDEVTLEEWTHLPKQPWMKHVVTTIRAVRHFRTAVDEAQRLLPTVASLVDDPRDPPVSGWRAMATGELRRLRGSILVGSSPDLFPSDMPKIGVGVLESLSEAVAAVRARMQKLISVREATSLVGSSEPDKEIASPPENAHQKELKNEPGTTKHAQPRGLWKPAGWFRMAIAKFGGGAKFDTDELIRAVQAGEIPADAVRGGAGKHRKYDVEKLCMFGPCVIFKTHLRKAIESGFNPSRVEPKQPKSTAGGGNKSEPDQKPSGKAKATNMLAPTSPNGASSSEIR